MYPRGNEEGPLNMRRTALVMLSVLLLLSGMTIPAMAQGLNCGDFGSQQEAQAVLDADPSDPNNLDPDLNGVACESLAPLPDPTAVPAPLPDPTAVPAPAPDPTRAPAPPPTGTQDRYNCDDFPFQEDAQAVYDADPNDPHGLDGPVGPDNDTTGIPGRACEKRPSRGTRDTDTGPTGGPVPNPTQESGTAPAPSQPSRTAPAQVSGPPTSQQNRACTAYDAWVWAQSVFESDPKKYEALDPDNDGEVCPHLSRKGFAPAFWLTEIPKDVEEAEVVRLIDGDTLEVRIDGVSNRVRIYRADTPENTTEKHCGGAEATAFGEYALSLNDDEDGTVYLERDKNEKDRHGRELAYVWFEVDDKPYMLNHVLINNGWAEDVDYGDRKYDDELKDAAAFADRHDLGVWDLCGGFGLPPSAAGAPRPANAAAALPPAGSTAAQAAAQQQADEAVASPSGCVTNDIPGTSGQPTFDVSTLDGRLGSTLDSFDNVYGAPDDDGPFLQYDIEGCGPVLVSDHEGSTVVDISVFAPREGEDQDYMEPDKADWTVEEAMQVAEAFLPADAVLNPPTGNLDPPDPGMLGDLIVVTGTSQLLLEQVPPEAYDDVDNSPTYGGFSYALFRTTTGDVSWMVIQLEIED